MTYEQAFTKIREGLKNADTSKLTGNFAIQVDLINKDCSGAFYVAYFDGIFAVEPYDYVDNTARLAIMYGDFNKLVSGKLNVQKAIAEEKIYVKGDITKVEELATLIKKTTVKKAAKPLDKKEASKTEATKKEKPTKKSSEKKEATVKKTASKKKA